MPAELLTASSDGAVVYFSRCEKCGAVWTHDKGDPNAPPTLVLRRRDDSRSA